MTGDKKNSDLSNRLKRPLKSTSKASKSSGTSTISTPPKATIAPSKAKKDDLYRRKNPFNEMLRQRSGKKTNSDGSLLDDDCETEPESDGPGSTSKESEKGFPDALPTDRIAELERELALTRKEHNVLREDFDKVKEHALVYKETIEDYKRQLAEYSTPHSEPSEDLLLQNRSFRAQILTLQEQLLSQESAYRARLELLSTRTDHDWEDMTNRLHRSEKESQERSQQLLDLKHSISALTRLEFQVTDSELSEKLDQIYHRICQWVISNFRRSKLDFSGISPEVAKTMEAIYPSYDDLDSLDRLRFYQSLVSHALMRVFDESVIIGLPQVGPLSPLRQLAAYINGAGGEFREWRRTTIRALEKSEAKHALQQEREKMLHVISSDLQHQLFSLASINLTPGAQTSLNSIIKSAMDLQNTLLLQKAQYIIRFFRRDVCSDTCFDQERMESVNDLDRMDEEGDTFEDRNFAFCVFPCLEKFGNEFGEQVGVRNVLLKARVCSGVG